MDWDSAVALSYAAEQVFLAAQVLTSDLVPTTYAVELAHRNVAALLDYERLFPATIRNRLKNFDAVYHSVYRQSESAGTAERLSTELKDILRELRLALNRAEEARRAQAA